MIRTKLAKFESLKCKCIRGLISSSLNSLSQFACVELQTNIDAHHLGHTETVPEVMERVVAVVFLNSKKKSEKSERFDSLKSIKIKALSYLGTLPNFPFQICQKLHIAKFTIQRYPKLFMEVKLDYLGGQRPQTCASAYLRTHHHSIR